jgi:co-chaperonin GroES (HSP10)
MTEEVKKPTQLPEPKGYFVLCALVDASETFESGLIKSSDTRKMEEISSPVLFVLKMGPEAYQDADKFPSGARCKEGDFVITRPYAGSRVKIYGKEFRLIADDQVEAVVDDPRGISRV